MRSIFALVIMAAVSRAAEEESSEPAETWDNMCFHCINEGNMYCVDYTVDKGDKDFALEKGKCMEATCIA